MKRWIGFLLAVYAVTPQTKIGKCLRYIDNDVTGCEEREPSRTVYRIGNDLVFTDQETALDAADALNIAHERRAKPDYWSTSDSSDTKGLPPSDEPSLRDENPTEVPHGF